METGAGRPTVSTRFTTAIASGASRWGIRWVYPDWNHPVTWLADKPLTVGRDEACDVCLPGDQLSRNHASIERRGGQVRVRDLGSTNGVFVDGIKVVGDAQLVLGSVVRFGEWIGICFEGVPEEDQGYGPIVPGYWGGQMLKSIMAPARRAAASELPIIIQGETGTGKEGAARAVHLWSGRKGAFLAVNCSALPESLAEGQLFGYRKGAFTGADTANPGYFRAADGGTLFLDEFADLPQALQPKLLRALEQKEIHPLGEPRPSIVDVRLLAAAQEPLTDLVEQKRLRRDLFARLHGLVIELPPLRARREDVPPLFMEMVARAATAARLDPPPTPEPRLIEQLCLYDWPFNVRELDLLVRRLVALHGHEPTLRRSHLPESMREFGSARSAARPSLTGNVGAGAGADAGEEDPRPTPISPEVFMETLRAHRGNVARAASALGISRQKAYRLMHAQGASAAAVREGSEGADEAGGDQPDGED
jgi:transcriptional regulator with AAA-type ATPase domain